MPFIVDRSPQRVVVSVQWAPPRATVLDLDVFRPGASVPAVPTSSKKLPQASIQAFDMKPSRMPGAWSVRVKRDLKSAEPVPYALNVIFLEKHLDYQFSLDNLHAVTGDKLGIRVPGRLGRQAAHRPPSRLDPRARLSRRRNRSARSCTMRRCRPTASHLGRRHPVSPLDQKIASFKGNSLVARLEQKEVGTIVLNEESRGVYVGTFDKTSIPGNYAFEVLLDWDQERTGHVHREERIEQGVLHTRRPDEDRGVDEQGNERQIHDHRHAPRQLRQLLRTGYESRITATLRTRVRCEAACRPMRIRPASTHSKSARSRRVKRRSSTSSSTE